MAVRHVLVMGSSPARRPLSDIDIERIEEEERIRAGIRSKRRWRTFGIVVVNTLTVLVLVGAWMVWLVWDRVSPRHASAAPGTVETVTLDVTPCTASNADMEDLLRIAETSAWNFSTRAVRMTAEHRATILKGGDQVSIVEDFGKTMSVRPLPGNHGNLDICVIDSRAIRQ